MEVKTYEGTVENGQIKLDPGVHLPEKAKVVVTLQQPTSGKAVHINSPRLVNKSDAARFKKRVSKEI